MTPLKSDQFFPWHGGVWFFPTGEAGEGLERAFQIFFFSGEGPPFFSRFLLCIQINGCPLRELRLYKKLLQSDFSPTTFLVQPL